jgi:hypothetical protein
VVWDLPERRIARAEWTVSRLLNAFNLYLPLSAPRAFRLSPFALR